MFQREESQYPKARKSGRYTREQAKKIAVAATASCVLLVLFLVIVLIIQFVKVGVANAERRKLEQESERLEQLIKDGDKKLQYYQTEDGLYRLAFKHGWSSKH